MCAVSTGHPKQVFNTTSPKSWLTLGFPIPKKSESVCALSMEE
jgi:hypothetical protein